MPPLTPDTWLSIVIPTHNRPDQLRTCLDSLLAQQKNAPCIEVLPVLNNATESVQQLARSYEREHRIIRVLHIPVANTSMARNCGWQHATAELIAFIDDDARAPANWIAEVHAFIRRNPEVAVFGGPYKRYTSIEPPAWFPPEYGNSGNFHSERPLRKNEWISGTNMFFKRHMIEALNGFREDLGPNNGTMLYGEETNLFKRLHDMEIACYTSPKIVIEHALLPHKLSLAWLLKSSFTCGKSHVKALERNNELARCSLVLIKSLLKGIYGFLLSKSLIKMNIYYSFQPFCYQLGVVAGLLQRSATNYEKHFY